MKRTFFQVVLTCMLVIVISCNTRNDQLSSLRNNWNAYIYTGETRYRFSLLGGIDAFDVPVRNDTDFLLDEVVIAINYIKKSGGLFKTEKLVITNVPPHSVKVGKAPDSPRGISVDLSISNIISRDMKFIYPGSRTNAMDPYVYN